LISSGIQPEMPGAWQLNEREVSSVAAYVRSLGAVPPEQLPGDAVRGARVYAVQGCAGAPRSAVEFDRMLLQLRSKAKLSREQDAKHL
jgi:hypothetical protein